MGLLVGPSQEEEAEPWLLVLLLLLLLLLEVLRVRHQGPGAARLGVQRPLRRADASVGTVSEMDTRNHDWGTSLPSYAK